MGDSQINHEEFSAPRNKYFLGISNPALTANKLDQQPEIEPPRIPPTAAPIGTAQSLLR
jgi:hypothetical protein